MKVQVLEEKISDVDTETGVHYLLGKDDTITVSDETGKRWCSYGWAKDVQGKVKTGARVEGAREVLQAQDADLGGK